ncbi:MotA/TolQ/ExbB proton channel family protein [Algiphilus sp.]|uniref:MotA/TolQ/ExbB proton channel family protein n=1 Tax=Algiphilus sp. TaxID=1872431 RepID=UPI0025C3B72A|nr:MotA/TolQ/ExbB proton channel family protein [Algiphilus sp.]MCK5772101.1 MotA/TolQ/ExbB proton channel family protein [Algiphilus sp.]
MLSKLQFLFSDIAFQVSGFLGLGGDVLLLIAVAICLMWCFIVERVVFFYLRYPQKARSVRALWEARQDHHSWEAHQIRNALLDAMRQQTGAYIGVVRTFVALCPLLGLLGTVTGMIAVFDVMAHAGMGNPRLMADGVAKATVPTMAGMVGALSGVFAMYWLDWQARTRMDALADHMETEHA